MPPLPVPPVSVSRRSPGSRLEPNPGFPPIPAHSVTSHGNKRPLHPPPLSAQKKPKRGAHGVPEYTARVKAGPTLLERWLSPSHGQPAPAPPVHLPAAGPAAASSADFYYNGERNKGKERVQTSLTNAASPPHGVRSAQTSSAFLEPEAFVPNSNPEASSSVRCLSAPHGVRSVFQCSASPNTDLTPPPPHHLHVTLPLANSPPLGTVPCSNTIAPKPVIAVPDSPSEPLTMATPSATTLPATTQTGPQPTPPSMSGTPPLNLSPNSLTIATYNLGGPSITKERFGRTISALSQAFPTLPKIVSLCEFKPTGAPLHEFEWMVTVITRGQYFLVSSTDPQGKNGIALLIHQDLSPHGPPSFSVVLPARILTFQAKIHADPNIPPVSFIAVYGSCLQPDRIPLQQALSPLLGGLAIVFGDLNAITQLDDVADMTLAYAQKLVWPWLRDMEASGKLVDLMRISYQDLPPKTRYRGHPGRSRLDNIFVTKPLLPLLSPLYPSTTPLEWEQHPLSDHDLVSVSLIPWTESTPPPRRCQSWGKKHIKRFQALCAEFHPNIQPGDMDEMTGGEQVSLMLDLQTHMVCCMEKVNSSQPRKEKPPLPEWASHIKSLLRLSRRNPKLFFRRVRHNCLTPMCSPRPPMDPTFLKSLVQESMPFDPSVVDTMPPPTSYLSEIPTPTDAELFQHSRVPRAKSPGPDGVPPYLFYILPPHLFHLFSNCIRLSLSLQCPLPLFFDATLIGLYKPKKDWWTASAWRPIAMSTAGYRIGMRFVKSHICGWTYSFLSPSQYGSRPGRSPASATHHLMATLSGQRAQGQSPHAVLLDVRNAFSSVPFTLLINLLEHLHFPPGFIQLFSYILHFGAFHIPQAQGHFFASSGIRQGCPLSAMLFVLYYELALRNLAHWHPIAFVDDIVAVTSSSVDTTKFIHDARCTLQRMGMDLNVSKSEVLVVGSTSPIPIPIPSGSGGARNWFHQPRPAQGQPAPPVATAPAPPAFPPSSLTSTTTVVHLGHPLTADLTPQSMYDTVMASVQDLFSQFHRRPLPMYARLKVLNQVLAPQVLYRLECLPPIKTCLDHLGNLTRKFLLALQDVPSFLANKTLFSHRKAGLGAFHLPTLVPQRVLDVGHRAIELFLADQRPVESNHWAVKCISTSCSVLGATSQAAQGSPPTSTHSTASSTYLPALDLPCYAVTHPLPLPDKTAYADGSYFPSVSQCASSVILPNGRAFVLRPRGKPSCYRAEVYALAMAVDVVGDEFTIYTDSAATLAAVKGASPRVTLASPIHHIRTMVAQKRLSLRHIRGHKGIDGNEMADRLAKDACLHLPSPTPQLPQNPWDVVVCGEQQRPPHKTWVRSHTPSHSQSDIHPWSWKPLVRPGWLPWLFGAKSVKGFAHPSTYWRNQGSTTPCPYCASHHNCSIHGSIGLCGATAQNPFVHAWLLAWETHMPLMSTWRNGASQRDRFLLGKLVLPNSLVATLKATLGPRVARTAATTFHRRILPLLTALLPQWSPEERCAFKRKLSAFEPGGWDTGPQALPTRARRSKPSTPHPPTSQNPITAYFLPPRPPGPSSSSQR